MRFIGDVVYGRNVCARMQIPRRRYGLRLILRVAGALEFICREAEP